MGTKQGSDFCYHCNEQVLTQQETPNHILHLLLTILVCGLWLPVWVVICACVKPARCSTCGLALATPTNWVLGVLVAIVCAVGALLIVASIIGSLG